MKMTGPCKRIGIRYGGGGGANRRRNSGGDGSVLLESVKYNSKHIKIIIACCKQAESSPFVIIYHDRARGPAPKGAGFDVTPIRVIDPGPPGPWARCAIWPVKLLVKSLDYRSNVQWPCRIGQKWSNRDTNEIPWCLVGDRMVSWVPHKSRPRRVRCRVRCRVR